MRLRKILPLPLFVLITTVVGAQAGNSVPSPVSAPPLCLEKATLLSASSQQGSPASLDGISFPHRMCGVCGDPVCRGAVVFSQCGYDPRGFAKFCYDVVLCSADDSTYWCGCGQPQ